MKQFWIVVYNDESHEAEFFGPMTDDTLYTFNVSEMVNAGLKVHCHGADIEPNAEDISKIGYKVKQGVYGELLQKFENKTGRSLKKW